MEQVRFTNGRGGVTTDAQRGNVPVTVLERFTVEIETAHGAEMFGFRDRIAAERFVRVRQARHLRGSFVIADRGDVVRKGSL